MFTKFSRSWSLAGQCWSVLMDDPVLLVFPLLSSIALIAVLITFALPAWALYHELGQAVLRKNTAYGGLFVFYVVNYAVVFFFNTALIGVVLRRLAGQTATVSDGLRLAFSRLPAVLGYAVIAATVGTILRAIEERVGFIGRIITSFIGAAWTLASAMTLPVLAAENVGPIDALGRSIELLRKNWGENLIGNVGISLAIVVVGIPLGVLAAVVLIFTISTQNIGLIIVAGLLFVTVFIGLTLVGTTLHTIYTAVLYRYASGNDQGGRIDQQLLAQAFRQR